MNDTHLNYSEAAKIVGVPIGTLYAMVFRKTIPHLRLGGRLVRFSSAELEAWLNSRRVSPVGKASSRRSDRR